MGLRAQARRRAGAGLRERRVGADLLPQPEAAGRRLSRAGGGAVASRSGVMPCSTVRSWPSIRRPGETSFARLQQRMQLRDPVRAGADRRPRRALPVRLPVLRGHRSHRHCRWWTARRCCATWYGTTIRSDSLPIAPPARPRCCARPAPRARKASSPSGPIPVRERAVDRLAQDEVRPAAGVRDRRLHRAPGLPRAPRRAAGGVLRGEALRYAGKVGHRIRPRTLEMLRTTAGTAAPAHLAVRPGARHRPARCSGSRRSWWRRSGSASGRGRTAAAPRFSASGTTRPRGGAAGGAQGRRRGAAAGRLIRATPPLLPPSRRSSPAVPSTSPHPSPAPHLDAVSHGEIHLLDRALEIRRARAAHGGAVSR